MANLLENLETIEQQIRLFDDVRPKGTRIFLLKDGLDSSHLSPIIEITGGYFVKNNKLRDQTQFNFATVDSSFGDKFAQMTRIAYGSLDIQNQIDVFSIEKRDKIFPNSAQPSWKCFGARIDNERFTAPNLDKKARGFFTFTANDFPAQVAPGVVVAGTYFRIRPADSPYFDTRSSVLGATIAETVENMAQAINAFGDVDLPAVAQGSGAILRITAKTIGASGNAVETRVIGTTFIQAANETLVGGAD